MEREYTIEMTITVDDEDVDDEELTNQTIAKLVLDSLEEAPFQVNVIMTK